MLTNMQAVTPLTF